MQTARRLVKGPDTAETRKKHFAMEYVVQVIMIIVCIAVVIIVMYFGCIKCRHTRTIFKYCFPFLPISCIICMSRHMDLFVEVTNITKGNRIWAHFASTRYFPSQIQLLRLIQKDDVQVETFCCIFKCIKMHDPVSHNCAVSMSYTYIILLHNLNSTELHLQGVAPRSQYSDHAPEAVTLQ